MKLSIAQAAQRTGLTERAIYDVLRAGTLTATGTPARLTEAAVNNLIVDRQIAALARIGGPSDLIQFAARTRKRAQELGGTRGTRMPFDTEATAVFGPAAVKAARIPGNARGCRWCWAHLTASVHGGLQPGANPRLYAAYVELLGPPCPEDTKRLVTALRGVVHPTPPDAPLLDSKPPAVVAAATVRPPAPGDSDAQLIARRRQALRGRLRVAQQAGDKRYAAQVRGLLTALTSSAVATPKTGRRADVHGCGCQCQQHRGQQ